MWHRFPQPMRNLILRALEEAARQGRAAAEPMDFVAAIPLVPESSAAQFLGKKGSIPDSVAPVNALSAETKKLFEQAYEESAQLNDRVVGTDHLLLAMCRAKLVDMPYETVHAKIKRARRVGFGPDVPMTKVNPIAAVARQTKTAIANLAKLYKIHVKLSAIHPKVVTDPYPFYDKLRAISPVRRDPLLPAWVVTGFPEVVAVFRDQRFSSEPRSNRTKSGTMEVEALPDGPVRRDLCVIANVLTKMMVFNDPPNHSRMRNQLGTMFSPRNVKNLFPIVQQITDEMIDEVAASGKMDLIQDFAYPLPLLVVAEIMGFRREDKVQLKRWSDVFATMLAFQTTIRQDLHGRQCMIEMREYFDKIVAELKAHPNDSLLSQILTPEGGSEPMDLDELFGNCVFLLAAGHETTTSVMGNGVLALLKHRDQMQKLMADPSLMPNAVEELLRFESPVQWTSRRAKEDLELAGVKIAKNSMVMVSMGAANRDARQFPEPNKLDITRQNANKNLAFSGGNHFCLGAALARIELQVGLTELLKRLKNIRVKEGFAVTWREGHTLHSFDSLPIEFDPVTAPARGQPSPSSTPPAPTASATT